MWFKIDDHFQNHPKVLSIPRTRRLQAVGLWTMLGVWCAAAENDGFVPTYMVEEMNGDDSLAEALVMAGLWEMRDDGYQFHDWADWQPSKTELDEKRRKHAAAQARYAQSAGRNKKDGTLPISRRSLIDQQGITDNPPTRPDPTQEEQHTPTPALREVSIDFQPNADAMAYAENHALVLEEQRIKFISHYRGVGKLVANADSAFLSWLIGSKERKDTRPQARGSSRRTLFNNNAENLAYLAEVEAEHAAKERQQQLQITQGGRNEQA